MTASELTLHSALQLLNSPIKIPLLGFGVYDSHTEVCIASIQTALKSGYRHIDTAHPRRSYGNEEEVGRAILSSGVSRSELFITSKIRVPADGAQDHYSSILESIQKIDPGPEGYVDLFLIHSPKPPTNVRMRVWFALERLLAERRVKSIGVSNWDVSRIEEMKTWGKRDGAVWPPMVNQIELHPFCQQKEIVSYCHTHNIAIEAYCPIVRNQRANDPTLCSLAEKYRVSTPQILIRYCLQKNWVALVKSDTPKRIVENSDVYGFELTGEDMRLLDGLNEGAAGAIVWAVRK
ncbi:aldo-keto reductase [Mollisia scopiformis]|uniref:Aldo-keto reductase n=1 Tax=Mollisia scopiformis TaxID=149040 RepID=A0A194XAV4_MOLSC|nr:aldo-keto reductase [Mollisia scopiformis]KUJ16892.1 aldo-keto reductase [Mollisia scopiformis]